MKRFLSVIALLQLMAGCAQQAPVVPRSVGQEAPPALDAYLQEERTPDSGLSATKRQILEEAGRTLGFRGGKAQRAWELRQSLEAKALRLDLLYDFRTLISAEGWLPPVISEATDVANITADQIRTGNKVYDKIADERFVSNPPSWRSWLLAGLPARAGDGPESSVTPEDATQKAVWERALRKGWDEGRESADHILDVNFNRITRDYRGMLLYSQLLRQDYMTLPVVTDQQQTVTGDSTKLTLGDRVRTLKQKAVFAPEKTRWRPVIRKEPQDNAR